MAFQDEARTILLPAMSKAPPSMFYLSALAGCPQSIHGTDPRAWSGRTKSSRRSIFFSQSTLCGMVYLVHDLQAWRTCPSFGGLVCQSQCLPREWLRLSLSVRWDSKVESTGLDGATTTTADWALPAVISTTNSSRFVRSDYRVGGTIAS